MLHELDKYMEKEALKYVRYADDFSIYCKSNYVARKTGNKIFAFLKDKLKLPVNGEKAAYVNRFNSKYWVTGMYPRTRREPGASTSWW